MTVSNEGKKSLLRSFILLWMKVLVSENKFSASECILSAFLLAPSTPFYFCGLQSKTLSVWFCLVL